MALAPLALPSYVLLWILDWLPVPSLFHARGSTLATGRKGTCALVCVANDTRAGVPEIKKLRLIEAVMASRRRVLSSRAAVSAWNALG
jgi:hypothetical protein